MVGKLTVAKVSSLETRWLGKLSWKNNSLDINSLKEDVAPINVLLCSLSLSNKKVHLPHIRTTCDSLSLSMNLYEDAESLILIHL